MADPVSAGIMAGGSLLSGIVGGKGASKAAKIQAQVQQQALAQQQAQFQQTQNNEKPFLSAGTSALDGSNGLLALLGLGNSGSGSNVDWGGYVNGNPDALAQWTNDPSERAKWGNDINAFGQFHYTNDGSRRDLTPYTSTANDVQATALSSLKNSPLFASIMGSGTDALLQNAAATGGLRGGNTQDALSRLGADTYASIYQNQLTNLMQLAGLGSSTAGTLANAGQANANAQTGILSNIGNAQATAAAAPYAGIAGGLNGAANAYGSYTSQNNLMALLKSVTGGGSGTSSGNSFINSGASPIPMNPF